MAVNEVPSVVSFSTPAEMPRRQLARRLSDAAISGIPFVGPFLTALYSVTHPEHAATLDQEWKERVTSTVNELIDIVIPTIKLSDDAIEVASYLARASRVGRGQNDFCEPNAIAAELSQLGSEAISQALGELELDSFIFVQRFAGGESILAPTNQLFWVFDPIAFPDTDPNVDARAVAEAIIADDYLQSEKFIEVHGWTSRRFNPAMTLLLDATSQKGLIVSRESNPDFVTLSVQANDLGKANLRRAFKIL